LSLTKAHTEGRRGEGEWCEHTSAGGKLCGNQCGWCGAWETGEERWVAGRKWAGEVCGAGFIRIDGSYDRLKGSFHKP